jgi:hypothetical protein
MEKNYENTGLKRSVHQMGTSELSMTQKALHDVHIQLYRAEYRTSDITITSDEY